MRKYPFVRVFPGNRATALASQDGPYLDDWSGMDDFFPSPSDDDAKVDSFPMARTHDVRRGCQYGPKDEIFALLARRIPG